MYNVNKIHDMVKDIETFKKATDEEVYEIINKVFEEEGVYKRIDRSIYQAIASGGTKVLYFKDERDIAMGIRRKLEDKRLLLNPVDYNDYLSSFCNKLGIQYGVETSMMSSSSHSRFYYVIR